MGQTWIGNAGALAPLRSPAELSDTLQRNVSSEQTLGGRDIVQWGHLVGREWSLGMSAATRPHTMAVLADLMAGGMPPWEFVTPWMAATNLLTPDATAFAVGTFTETVAVRSGAATALDGTRFAASMVPMAAGYTYVGMHPRRGLPWRGVAVVPGEPVTYSMYLTGSGTTADLRMTFFDVAGNVISNVDKVVTLVPGGLAQMSSSTVVPAGAAWVNLLVRRASLVAGLALTFTDKPVPYSAGEGVRGVYVDAISKQATMIVPGNVMGSQSFTVKEIR